MPTRLPVFVAQMKVGQKPAPAESANAAATSRSRPDVKAGKGKAQVTFLQAGIALRLTACQRRWRENRSR